MQVHSFERLKMKVSHLIKKFTFEGKARHEVTRKLRKRWDHRYFMFNSHSSFKLDYSLSSELFIKKQFLINDCRSNIKSNVK